MNPRKQFAAYAIGILFLLIVIGLALINLITIWNSRVSPDSQSQLVVAEAVSSVTSTKIAAPTLTSSPKPPATLILTHTAVPPSPTSTPTQTVAPTIIPSPTPRPTNTALPPSTHPPQPTQIPPTTQPAAVLLLDDFESLEAVQQDYWINAPGNVLTFALSDAETAVSGQAALALQFSINHGPPSDYVGIERSTFAPMDWRDYSQICVWVQNGAFSGHLVIQFREFGGEVWKHSIPLQTVQTQDICIPLIETQFVLADHSPEQNTIGGAGQRKSQQCSPCILSSVWQLEKWSTI